MKIVYCPNTPDGLDYDVWDGNKLLGRFEGRAAATRFIKTKGALIMEMRTAIERYLEENYEDVPNEKVPELAEMIENYMTQFAIPDIIQDFGE